MRKTSRLVGAIVVFSALALAVPAAGLAQGRGRGQDKKAEKSVKPDKHDKDKNGRKDGPPAVVVVDRDGHLRVIHEYYRAGSLPPGLAKRDSLPPGLRKQLRERGELPPGLQKHLVPVPAVLISRLPPVPVYYQRYFAGDDLIVVDTRTNRIATIIVNVWR